MTKPMTELCENPVCNNPAWKRVSVSIQHSNDATRNLCRSCNQAYCWGLLQGKALTRLLPVYIVVLTNRAMAEYVRAFDSMHEAEERLVAYLRKQHRFGQHPDDPESWCDWVGEQAYLHAEIIEQDALRR
jgi:hypothetical protein